MNVAQSGLKLVILLPQPPRCLNYRPMPLCLFLKIQTKTSLSIYLFKHLTLKYFLLLFLTYPFHGLMCLCSVCIISWCERIDSQPWTVSSGLGSYYFHPPLMQFPVNILAFCFIWSVLFCFSGSLQSLCCLLSPTGLQPQAWAFYHL